jgi:transposase
MTDSTVSIIGVGIDTARYGHHVSFLDQEKRSATKPFHFTENADGYRRLKNAFLKLQSKHPGLQLHIRIDAAGQYAENLIQWLHLLRMPTVISVGQPAMNKAYRNAHFNKRKADPVESLACARFAVVERPAATLHNPPEFSQLRDVVALMESSSKQRTRLVNQLHGLLARAFPEFATLADDIAANWALKLLLKYPTAERIAAARLDSLLKIPHLDLDKAISLQQAAKESTGSAAGPVVDQLIKQKVRAILDEQKEARQLEELVKTAFDALPNGPHQRLITIKGIGLQTAAALVAKIVSIERFNSASALIGYFAVFPEEVDVSGTDKNGKPKKGTEVRMCRKGNDLVRRLLYTAAQCAAKHNPAVRALFTRQIAAGKEYNVAIGHCMAKLLRQVFGIWKTDRDFDPDYETKQINDKAEADEQEPTVQEKVVGHKKRAVKPQQQVVTTTTSILPDTRQPSKRRSPKRTTESPAPAEAAIDPFSQSPRSSRDTTILPAQEPDRLPAAGEKQSWPNDDPTQTPGVL